MQWISCELKPWYDSDGQIGGVLMYTADITKIKEMEALNTERKIFLEAILDSIDVGIVSCDQDGKLNLFNKATRDWHGLPPENIPTSELSNYYGLYKTDGVTPLKEEEIPLLKVLKNGGIKEEELTIITKSGVVRRITTNGAQLINADGSIIGAVVAMHDITKIREVEAINNERQIFLEAILDNIDVGVASYDRDGNIVLFNKTTKKWFGLPDVSVPISEWSNYFGLYKEDGKTPLIQEEIPLLKALNGEEVHDYEIVITTTDKEKRHVTTNASRLLDSNGEVFGAVVALHDITDRKYTEDKLRESEEAFRGNFENAAIGMAIIDLNGQWIEVNNAVSNIVGYSIEELNSMTFQDITHPDDVEKDIELLHDLLGNKISFYHLEKRYVHKDGRTVYIILSVSLVRDANKNPLYFVSQIIDISQRINTRKKLQETLANFEGILEASSQVAIIGTDIDGLITNFNTGAENLLGYSREELILKESPALIHDMNEMISVGKELSISFGEEINGFEVFTAIANTGEHFTREWTYIKKDGTQFPVQLTVTAIKDENDIIGYLGVATDINEIKSVEKELQSLLEVSKDQNGRLLNFAHIVSHNLKSHSGNFEMLLDLYMNENPEAANSEIIQLFITASKKLSDTIFHLNEVVLINNSVGANLSLMKLGEVVDNVIKTIAGIAIDADVEIRNNISDEIAVMAVPAYLDSIILNFITNGIKYRSDKRKSYVSFDVKQDGDFSVISIVDNGLGMDLKRNRSKLFGMYKTFHDNPDARGIGLFITKSQIEALGGRVDVISEVGKGTEFIIYLKNGKV